MILFILLEIGEVVCVSYWIVVLCDCCKVVELMGVDVFEE